MKPERWQQLDNLFHSALQREPAQRASFLDQACDGDESLRKQVEALVTAHERAGSFIERPAMEVEARGIAGDQGNKEESLATGETVSHYRIISSLGSGGMGDVYLAHDTVLGRQVALKLLPQNFTSDQNRLRRFQLEARAASALNHPNIVTIHEIGKTDFLHFIATEFVDGETLREHMTNTRITLGEVLDIAAQIGSALQAAHQAGIVHRDIKPENIMVRRDGVVKVLDFGLAKLTPQHVAPDDRRAPAQSMVQTNPGVVMGTAGYMSPEQARGQQVDARTDIWSLGVVLYELLAGRAPFGGETPSHVIVSILETEPSSLGGDGGVPAELGRIVAKALEKERDGRFQTAGELALELKNLKAELEVEARLKLVLKRNPSGENLAPRGTGSGVKDTFGEPSASTAQLIPARPTVSFEYLVGGLKRHKIFAGAALLVLLVGAIGLMYFAINRNKANPGAPSKKSIAVLPVKPINATTRDEIFEIGIADSLINQLSSMKAFLVRPLSATRRYADIEQDPLAAGREQQVEYVLASNYQLADGKIGITAQLLNVASGQIEQTYKIEKDSSNVFAMQDAIAMELGNKLLTQFATTSNRLTQKRGTTNEEAYRLYLQGMYLANSRNEVDAKKAVEALEQAVRLDPNYAVAWAGLAYAQRALGLRTGDAHEAHQKSIEAINRALALDPNLSEAHSALCENKYLYEWDFVGAERACIRAIELSPDSSQAHDIFSRYLMGRGRHDEAIAEIKTAIDLEPTSRFFQRNYGRALYYARRYPEAVAQFKRVNEMDPKFDVGWLSRTLALQGNESEAFESFLSRLSLAKVDEEIVKAFKTAFQTSGWQGVLRERVKRREEVLTITGNRTGKQYDVPIENNFEGAADHAQLGNKDKAFEYLEKVYQRREVWITFLQVDPRFDALRDDPRYAELVSRIKSK